MSFLTNLFAASPDNPRFNLNDPIAWDSLGASPSASGMPVSRQTALGVPAFWRAVNLLSGDVGKLPLFIYKREQEGKVRAPEHAGYRLLRWKPSDLMTSKVWKQTCMGHMLTKGNAYTYIYRNGDGSPREFLMLDPEATWPILVDGAKWITTTINKVMRKLRAEDVLHFHGLGYDGLIGYDVIQYQKDPLGLSQARRRYEALYFKNSAKPSVIILVPGSMPPTAKDELRSAWERMSGGLDNAHRTAVLDRGATLKELSANAKDSQLVEQEKMGLVDVANIFGIPVHKVGGEGRTAFASLEQENQSYLDDGLDPWLVTIEEECRDKLLTEAEKDADSHSIEFNRKALVRANLNDRANYYKTAAGGRPWMTPNEVREIEDMNTLDGEADELIDPANIVGSDAGADKAQPEPGEPAAGAPAAADPNAPPTAETGDQAAKQGNVQGTALNGAQITALAAIMTSQASGEFPAESVRAALQGSFPLFDKALIDKIVDELDKTAKANKLEEAKKPPMPPPAPGQAPGQPPQQPAAPPPAKPAPPTKAVQDAHRTLLTSQVHWTVKRIGQHAERAAKDGAKFLAWLEDFRAEYHEPIGEALDPISVTLAATAGGEPKDIGAWLMIELMAEFNALADRVTPKTLASECASLVATLETRLPEAAAKAFLTEVET